MTYNIVLESDSAYFLTILIIACGIFLLLILILFLPNDYSNKLKYFIIDILKVFPISKILDKF